MDKKIDSEINFDNRQEWEGYLTMLNIEIQDSPRDPEAWKIACGTDPNGQRFIGLSTTDAHTVRYYAS